MDKEKATPGQMWLIGISSRAKFGRLTRHLTTSSMSDTTNIHQVGVQINFNTWERFNLEELTNDGVVLFQYLVFHCQSVPEWTHSDNDLRHELGIKRGRITALRDKFVQLGFLDTSIVKDRNDNNIRAYRIKFGELAKPTVLSQIYRTHDAKNEPYDLSQYSQIYKSLASSQPKKDKKDRAQQYKEMSIRSLATTLENIFDSRRNDYNKTIKKRMSTTSGPLRLAVGSIKFSPKQLRQLGNAVKATGDIEYIKNAFTVYCDAINSFQNYQSEDMKMLLPTQPRSPLNYFLSYSSKTFSDEEAASEGVGFAVIYSFGDYHASHYGQNA